MKRAVCTAVALWCALGCLSCREASRPVDSRGPGGRGGSGGGGAPVRVATVVSGTIRQAIEYTADIRARDEAVVYSRVPGKVQARIREDGDRVKKGDPIVWVDRDEVGLTFERAPVESPLDGVVGRVYVDRGVSVTPQTPIALVVDLSEARAMLDVPERYVPLLSTALVAEASVDAWPWQVFTGTVRKVSPVVDVATRTTPVEIRMANPDGRLMPGMFARVRLVLKERQGAVLVPREAIMGRGSEAAVYVVADGGARLRKVRLGLRQEAEVEIEEGLQAGETVVVMGQQRLTDGAAVQVDEPEGAGAAPPAADGAGPDRRGGGKGAP